MPPRHGFGSWDEPIVQSAGRLLTRLGQGTDPCRYAAVGDADAIVARVDEYVAAGASKFVLRPLALGDAEMADQTARLVAEVLPRVHR